MLFESILNNTVAKESILNLTHALVFQLCTWLMHGWCNCYHWKLCMITGNGTVCYLW